MKEAETVIAADIMPDEMHASLKSRDSWSSEETSAYTEGWQSRCEGAAKDGPLRPDYPTGTQNAAFDLGWDDRSTRTAAGKDSN